MGRGSASPAVWQGSAETFSFCPGDILVLYSDALIESRNERRESFGEARVAEILRANAHLSADEIADALVAGVKGWGEIKDDMTLVVCRRPDES